MTHIDDYITEMSAMHNRKNDELAKQRNSIEAQMRANSVDDMNRILAMSGMGKDKRARDIYDFTINLACILYRSDKPYGAILYLLLLLKEYADKNAAKNKQAAVMSVKLAAILSDPVMSNLVAKDPAYDGLIAKLKDQDEITGKHAANVDSLEYQIAEIKAKYPEIEYWDDRDID